MIPSVIHFLNIYLGHLIGWFGGLGVTGGAHRLWTHRSFKAKWPLRLLAAIAQTSSGQVNYNILYYNDSSLFNYYHA